MKLINFKLYLTNEIKNAYFGVSKHLTNLPELKDEWRDEKIIGDGSI